VSRRQKRWAPQTRPGFGAGSEPARPPAVAPAPPHQRPPTRQHQAGFPCQSVQFGVMANSPEARRVRRELDQQLADAGRGAGMTLVWSAAEREILDLIRDQINRKCDLQRDYAAAEDARTRVQVSAELRLLESSVERLLRRIKTDVPAAPESIATVRARAAATKRWDAARASGEIA
jgi:hypothetical protein